jgi:hypothetical protein
MIVAQTKEVRNGLKIQKLAAISTPMKRTARVIRVMSREADAFIFATSFLFAFFPALFIPSRKGKE